MSQPLPWHWLLAISVWNPLPRSNCHVPKGFDSYCPKPYPLVAPIRSCLPDDYEPKPFLAPRPDCRVIDAHFPGKAFPILRGNSFTGSVHQDGCPGPGFFGLRPRPQAHQ